MKFRTLLLGTTCLIAFASCGSIGSAITGTTSSVTGAVTLTDADGKVTTFTPEGCDSGEHSSFLGFDLYSSKSKMQLRGVIQPIDGGAVRIRSNEGGEYANVVLHENDCQTLDITISPTNWSINDYQDYNDKVTLDCKSSAGAHITGSIDIKHCH